MQVSYKQLMDGYFLKDGDRLENIHGYTRFVVRTKVGNNKIIWYLYNSCDNYRIYRELGLMCPSDKPAEFDSQLELTEHVKRLYAIPEFSPGDKVRVRKYFGNDTVFPFTMVEDMKRQTDKVFTIQCCVFIPHANPELFNRCNEKDFRGDLFCYRFKEDTVGYSWHSTMFELYLRKQKDLINIDSLRNLETIEIGQYKLQVFDSASGWFLGESKELLEELGIRSNVKEMFEEHGIKVTCPGIFPFVATSQDLQKACDLLRNLLEKKKSSQRENEDKPDTCKRGIMESIITIDNHRLVNTDIIL